MFFAIRNTLLSHFGNEISLHVLRFCILSFCSFCRRMKKKFVYTIGGWRDPSTQPCSPPSTLTLPTLPARLSHPCPPQHSSIQYPFPYPWPTTIFPLTLLPSYPQRSTPSPNPALSPAPNSALLPYGYVFVMTFALHSWCNDIFTL